MNIQISVGIEELAGLVEVTLFPNPTNSNATIAIENKNAQNANIMIVNQLGQVITSQEVELANGNNSIELATNSFESGIYTVILVTETGRINRKLIVQK